MANSELFEDLSQVVECPLCLEPYSNPQTLECHHTFCKTCIEKTKGAKIECYICRKKTSKKSISHDFKVEHLVDLFKNHDPNKKPLAVEKCMLCEECGANVFCRKCNKFLCKICAKAHRKITGCLDENAHDIPSLAEKLTSDLGKQVNDLKREVQKKENESLAASEEVRKLKRRKLRYIAELKYKALGRINTHFEGRRNKVLHQFAAHELARRNYEEEVSRAKNLCTEITGKSQTPEEWIKQHQNVKARLASQLEKIKQDACPSSCSVCSKKEELESTSGTFKKQRTTQPDGARKGTSVATTSLNPVTAEKPSNPFTSGTHNVNRLPSLSSPVIQVTFVEGKLWALHDDHITVLNSDGSVFEEKFPGGAFKGTKDMCLSRSRHVIVATTTGLLELTVDAKILKVIDEGSYYSVTNGENLHVWAIKLLPTKELQINSFRSSVLMTMVRIKQITVPRTFLSESPYHYDLYCACLGRILYICTTSEHTIHAFDTQTEKIVVMYGSRGAGGGEKLSYPYCLYSHEKSGSLHVVDSRNRSIKTFTPDDNQWSTFKVPCENHHKLKCAAFDKRGNAWVYGWFGDGWVCQSTN